MRLVFLAAAIASASVAWAEGPASPPPVPAAPTPAPAATEVDAQLATLTAATTPEARLAAARAVVVGGEPTPWVQALARARSSTVDARRSVLVRIGAAVPDAKGKFETPKRQAAAEVRANDELDWLAELVRLDARDAAVQDVLIDVALMRALAASKAIDAAEPLFAIGFATDTLIYRDEVGRQLRAMSPYVVPALIRRAQAGGDAGRYANYQLERIDRQDPQKALDAAVRDEGLAVAILDAFRETRHREAVHAVYGLIDSDAPRVRDAARATWLGYVTGPAPKPAKTRRLELPGGKLSAKATPLWSTYRELADHELKKALEELFGEVHADDAVLDLEATSKRIFAHVDAEAAKRWVGVRADAETKLAAGDALAACALYDRVRAAGVTLGDQAPLHQAYLACADSHAKASAYVDAAAAFAKAHAHAGAAGGDVELARHHLMLAKAAAAAGHDGSAEMAVAVRLDPSLAERVAEAVPPPPAKPWFLYGALAAAGLALVSFVVGLTRRRA